MNEQEVMLENEVAIGNEYKHAWETLVKPFFDKKQSELYEAFKDANTAAADHLLLIKLQCNALSALESEFKHYINTGTLAGNSLMKLKEGHNEH